ncbi:cohesin complex subunit SCC1 [Strigomonas culicis]|uniref:Cohesin complex subunit SCC1 n=1 Tax=Strigomonas culicis TaxID=28005 RepID=S9TLS5_9TRYP|nr:cohesin complex subunit SCC1 [Strigomonas culicis]|eukprot:EPY19157.1 cohesin complex subunit SCC1 [Strigomonas culicis]
MPDNADARFDAIADLLHGRGGAGEDGALPSAWYAADPHAQAADELRQTQQDYDEIAKMRADLLAFGERTSSSHSKSKSSLSSIEKARGSLAAGDVPFPPVGDELDIGVPLPEELPTDLPGGHADMAPPENPFDFPEVMAGAAEQAPPAGRAAKRVRPVNVLDLAATTLPRQTFERNLADRSDILESEPRRGPLDAAEARDRYTIVGGADPADAAAAVGVAAALPPLVDAAPLSHVPGAALRAAYAAALQRTVAAAVEAALHASQDAPRRAAELPAGGLADDDYFAAAPPAEQAPLEAEGPKGLSVNALTTLERIRDEVARVSGAKRSRGSAGALDLIDRPCLFRDVAGGMRRREAARTFVDMLALAAKQLISARQDVSTRDVEITLREESVSVLAAQ